MVALLDFSLCQKQTLSQKSARDFPLCLGSPNWVTWPSLGNKYLSFVFPTMGKGFSNKEEEAGNDCKQAMNSVPWLPY